MIIHDIKLDMVPGAPKKEVWLSQYDEDFILRVTLYARTGQLSLPSGTTAEVKCTKPDGNGYSADASISDSVVTITGHQQMTAVAGKVICEVSTYKNSKELSTANFIINVERAALDRDTIPSASVIRELLDVTDRAEEIIDAASDSEAYAAGTRGGEDVTSGDDAYHNNSKYYSEQAAAALNTKADSTSIAPDYSATGRYAVGALCTHNGALYKCNTAITSDEAWTAGHWMAVSVDDELADLKGDLSEINGNEVISFDGFNDDNSSNANFSVSPFILNYSGFDYSGWYVNKIKLKVITAGTLSIGTIKKNKAIAGQQANRSDAIVKAILNIANTGINEVYITNKFSVGQDEYLFLGMPSDTCIFTYGSYGVNKGFLAYSSGTWGNVNSSIGVSIYAVHPSIIDSISKTFVSRFNGKKISIIGDSIDTFDAPGYKIDGYNMYYPALGVEDVKQTWWKQVIDNSGADLEINASWSGSRVTNTHSSPDFYDRVSVIGTPDMIFVTLGSNDSTAEISLGEYDFVTAYSNLSEAQFRPAYIKGVKALKTLYPSATIICVTQKMNEAYRDSIETIAKTLNVEYIDASDYTGQAGVHPGVLGMRQIASLILFPTDTNFWQKHYPADAKSVGDRLDKIQEEIDSFEGISDPVKQALLNVVSHIALWTDGHGQEYYDALYDALYSGSGISYPDLTTGIIHAGYYDASGDVVASEVDYYNEKYFPVEQETNYIWVRGIDGFTVKNSQDVYKGNAHTYRVCYYNSEKEFLSRETSPFSTDENYIEARYFQLTVPAEAAYFRVSWSRYPVGKMYKSIPEDIYAVLLIIANLDDSEIAANTTLMNNVSFTRNGIDIKQEIVYGRPDITVPSYSGTLPENNALNSVVSLASVWFRNVFNANAGGSPEYGTQHTETTTRIQTRAALLMKKGDVIHFNNVKAGVRAERILDGYVQYTTAWITDNSDFVVGGDE